MSLGFTANSAAVLIEQEHASYNALSATNPCCQFLHYFQATQADSAEQKNSVYRLRHKVYCEELHFEPVKAGSLEQDAFDYRSVHIAVNHIASNSIAGTVRIVTSTGNDELLPIERYFANQLNDSAFAPQNFDRQQVCEISRLAVPAEIRCASSLNSNALTPERECSKLVAISLYLIAQILCLRDDRVHAYVMIEPVLARVLRRVGINFIQIGKPIEFNGIRAPYYLDARTMSATLKPDYLQLLTLLEQQLLHEPQRIRPQLELCYSAS